MFKNILNKLKEIFRKEEEPQKVQHSFEYTGYEIVDDNNMPRMFYPELFDKKNQLEQLHIMQERVNRLTTQFGINQPLKINITEQTKDDIDLVGNTINVSRKALNTPVILYAQLVGITERARQIQYAKEHPDSTIGIILNNKTIQTMTGLTYDQRNITPTKGKGSLNFGKTVCTLDAVVDKNYNEIKAKEKAESSDYYISRMQPTERLVSMKLEKALREMQEMMDNDTITDKSAREQLAMATMVVGNYGEDRIEYIARTKVENPETELDNFIIEMNKNPKGMFVAKNDIIDTDIKMASIHAYNHEHQIPVISQDDPRHSIELNYTKEKLKTMSDKDFISLFYPQNWEQLALDEKKMIIQEQCNRETQKLGLHRNYDVKFEGIHTGADAYYRQGESTVHFSEAILTTQSPLSLYGMLPHELVHAKQNEMALGLIPASEEQQKYYSQLWTVRKNLTTPGQYHNKEVPQINGESLKSSAQISYFEIPNPSKIVSFTPERIVEANALYRLQPIEREAYEYQEKKSDELEELMRDDGVLNKQYETAFKHMKICSIDKIEKEIQSNYGCKNPTEAIRQFQLYTIGATKDYSPQTSEFDFAMRFNLLSQATCNQYGIHLKDPRDTIEKDPIEIFTSVYKKGPWFENSEVTDRMSRLNQQYPQQYVEPLSDEIKNNIFTLDMVRKYMVVDEEIDEVPNESKDKIASGTTMKDEVFTNDDITYIMNALGEQPLDLDNIIKEMNQNQPNTDLISLESETEEFDLE